MGFFDHPTELAFRRHYQRATYDLRRKRRARFLLFSLAVLVFCAGCCAALAPDRTAAFVQIFFNTLAE